jgi:MFS family permease
MKVTVVAAINQFTDSNRYQGLLGSCVGLGNTIGPFVAAGFTRNLTWRGTFYFIAPLAICIAILLFFLLPKSTIPPEPVMTKLRKVDYGGIVLSCAGTIILLIPISGIQTQFDPSSPMAISMITIGAILLILFLLNEWKLTRLPMFPCTLLSFWRSLVATGSAFAPQLAPC